ncbi:MAG: ArnT family glycosyltransferase [Planctomycetaceae bacterium]
MVALTALALLHLGLGLDQARRHSVTHDEYWHLPAGVAGWREARFDLDNLNPPLTRLFTSLPALGLGVELPRGLPADDAFRLGDEFLKANRALGQTPWIWARGLNLLLSLATALVLWRWGEAWLGRGVGLFAGCLWLTCPLVLAHASLVTPDVGATLLFVATLAATHRLAQQPTPSRALLTGCLLGLAQLTKFTNVLLLGLVPLTWLATRLWLWRSMRIATRAPSGPGTAPAPSQWAWSLGVVAGWALLIWNVGYLGQGTGTPLADYPLRSTALQSLRDQWPGLARLPLPVPRDYVAGFDRQRSIMEGSHPVYLNGEWNLAGFPLYYLWCAAYKWPHATQLLVLAGLAGLAWRAAREDWLPALVLGVPAAAVWGSASALGMQLGFRYVLPSLPLLYLAAGLPVAWLWRHHRAWVRWLGSACLLALSLGLRHHPAHLAYFNEWAGGPEGGRRYLADSNIDWGQDLLALKAWLNEHDIDRVGLAYFGMVPPGELGFHYDLPPSRATVNRFGRPPAGWYAVSVNFVLGRPHTIRLPDGTIRGVGYQEYGYFRSLKPVATLGGSLDIYRIDPPGQEPFPTNRPQSPNRR